jgi:heme exporter protein B
VSQVPPLGNQLDQAKPQALGTLNAFAWAVKRDFALAGRSLSELALVIVFFLLVTSLFPLAISPDKKLLSTIAPGIVWVAALLANLLALPRLFAVDHSDGSLEQLVLANAPLPALVAGKVVAHWFLTGLPVVLLAPLAGLQFGLPVEAIQTLVLALLLGTPILSWLGAIAAALTLGTRAGASLLALLVLPLTVPVLIFGAGAVESQASGLGYSAHFSLLGAGLIFASLLGPWFCALAVKIALE